MDEYIIRVSEGFTRHFSGGPARRVSGGNDPI